MIKIIYKKIKSDFEQKWKVINKKEQNNRIMYISSHILFAPPPAIKYCC